MMSDKKAVFFDADGTICDIEKGVPDSAIESIKKLIANGHQAWLCTGRSRAFVPWYLERIPFTGMISACGATIEKDGKRLYNNEMTPEVAEKSVEILRKYGLIPVMEGADYMYYDKDEYTTEVNWYADQNGVRSEVMNTVCISIRSVPRCRTDVMRIRLAENCLHTMM